jgi:hypothetical protein
MTSRFLYARRQTHSERAFNNPKIPGTTSATGQPATRAAARRACAAGGDLRAAMDRPAAFAGAWRSGFHQFLHRRAHRARGHVQAAVRSYTALCHPEPDYWAEFCAWRRDYVAAPAVPGTAPGTHFGGCSTRRSWHRSWDSFRWMIIALPILPGA